MSVTLSYEEDKLNCSGHRRDTAALPHYSRGRLLSAMHLDERNKRISLAMGRTKTKRAIARAKHLSHQNDEKPKKIYVCCVKCTAEEVQDEKGYLNSGL